MTGFLPARVRPDPQFHSGPSPTSLTESGQKGDSEQLTDESSGREIDPIVTLIQAHPENDTAPDTKTPLTEDELLSTLTLSLFNKTID